MPDLTFIPSDDYPGGTVELLMLGQQEIGGLWRNRHSGKPMWDWECTLPGCRRGWEVTEQAAKNALLAEARDWLRKAGLDG
jgi:hypothetical protein